MFSVKYMCSHVSTSGTRVSRQGRGGESTRTMFARGAHVLHPGNMLVQGAVTEIAQSLYWFPDANYSAWVSSLSDLSETQS
jgi:hypothetical protein